MRRRERPAGGVSRSPDIPANYLGTVNQSTGTITKFAIGGAKIQPKGMIYVP